MITGSLPAELRVVQNNTPLSPGEIRVKSSSTDTVVQLKVRALQMLSDELVESERWIFSALHMLKETVKSSAANSLDRVGIVSFFLVSLL